MADQYLYGFFYFYLRTQLKDKQKGKTKTPATCCSLQDGVMREMKGKVGEVGVRMYVEGRKWVLNLILFADDTVLNAENESGLQNLASTSIAYVKGES